MLDKYDQLEEGFKSAIEKVTEDLGMITSSQNMVKLETGVN